RGDARRAIEVWLTINPLGLRDVPPTGHGVRLRVRPSPDLIGTLCWLSAVAVAAGAVALFGPGKTGLGSAALAGGGALGVNYLLARRARLREQRKLERIAAAVGADNATTEGIVASLSQRLERANAFRSAFV